MDRLAFGDLTVSFHRTVQVDPNSTLNLPPSLGRFKLYKAVDYPNSCPASWDERGYFIALHEREAMWLSFEISEFRSQPKAMLIGAGGINALTGEKLGIKLEKDNYVVMPPQPWLDGWVDQDGNVYQFVATEFKKGEGLSVGEQILKSESHTGGIGLAVFDLIEPVEIKETRPEETILLSGGVGLASLEYDYSEEECCSFGFAAAVCSTGC